MMPTLDQQPAGLPEGHPTWMRDSDSGKGGAGFSYLRENKDCLQQQKQ